MMHHSTPLELNQYEYDIFGETTLCIEEYANPFRYSGEYTDEETGNVYLRARYYNPETGRFITRDSFAGIKEQPNTLNRYVYCGNDPVNYVDPSGHFYDERYYNWAESFGVDAHGKEVSEVEQMVKEAAMEMDITDSDLDYQYAAQLGVSASKYRIMKRLRKSHVWTLERAKSEMIAAGYDQIADVIVRDPMSSDYQAQFEQVSEWSESENEEDVAKAESYLYYLMDVGELEGTMVNDFIHYYMDQGDGINYSGTGGKIYQMLDDCAPGWTRDENGRFYFDENEKNMYDDYKFSIFDALGWMTLTGGNVNFVLIMRGYYGQNLVEMSDEERYQQFATVEKMQINIIEKFAEAYSLLDDAGYQVKLPQFFVGATEDFGGKEVDFNYALSLYNNVEQVTSKMLKSVEIQGDMIAGFYYSNEDSIGSEIGQKAIAEFRQGFKKDHPEKQIIWVPYMDSNNNFNDLQTAIDSNWFDIIIIQPGTYFKDYNIFEGGTNTVNATTKAKMVDLKDFVEKNKGKNTLVGVQFEYDMGMVTGRVPGTAPDIFSMTPQQKQAAFEQYLEVFYPLIGKVPIGIYSGGPNEQGFRNLAGNVNTLNTGNHVPYVKIESMKFNEFPNAYQRNLIYDISRNLLYHKSNNWEEEWNQMLGNFKTE